ncbi:hypothetical protein CEXT_337431 [Caerostris extrusa]|uniref:Uncharacterized protein n=1 Tax=Caerostris extrusa TaxID=172846 RepID=A0AAV4N4F8_CAEEX|nr:hypothetical protein CEXT_337431 [Caerostris extrusa]
MQNLIQLASNPDICIHDFYAEAYHKEANFPSHANTFHQFKRKSHKQKAVLPFHFRSSKQTPRDNLFAASYPRGLKTEPEFDSSDRVPMRNALKARALMDS